MQSGPPASRPPSNHRLDDRRGQTLPSLDSRTLPPIHDGHRSGASYSDERIFAGAPNGASQLSSDQDRRPSRPIGMQSILNPTGRDISEGLNRTKKSDHFELPSPAPSSVSRVPSNSMTPSPGSVSLPSITPPSTDAYLPPMGPGSRQNLPSRSTSGFAPNALVKNIASGTIDAKRSPFVVAATDASGVDIPAHSDIPGSSFSGPYGVSGHSAKSPTGLPQGGGALSHGSSERRPSASSVSQPPGSLSNSPSTSYSSYSQFARTPPAQQPAAPVSRPSSAFYGPPYPASGAVSTLSQNFGSKEAFTSVSTTTGQGAYRMMTFDTDQGPIQVPVDVQAASKVADEKRKRNATASHRFRQRRKEKERETSQNIAKLEHQVRDVAEEREYYRQERDYFRSLICRNPSQVHLAARPPSPRHLRMAQAGGEDAYGAGEWQLSDDNSRQSRNTRRRTSSYMPPQDIPQAAALPRPQTYNTVGHNHTPSADVTPAGYQSLPTQDSLKRRPFDPPASSNHGASWQGRR